MLNINYSFVVPYHNNPDLLNRLIDSIPQRGDIEIIVVDDNSDADKKLVALRDDCKIVYIDALNTKGAGKARNVGMNNASGTWLLFADSDDMYENGFLDILDQYSKKEIDILYFDVYYAWDLNQKKEKWAQRYSLSIANYLRNPQSIYWLKMVKHVIQPPWNFMVRRDYVQRIDAKFEEIPKGNDAFFHHYVSMNTEKCAVIGDKLYYWLWSENGITRKKRTKEYYLKSLDCVMSHINLRVKAGAWATVPALHNGFLKICREQGFFFAILILIKKFYSPIPWTKVWWHKLTDKKD